MKKIFKEILNKIKEKDVIMIHGHIRPDGDCYGSQFGLQEILKLNFPEKKVFVVGQTCDYCSFLGQPDVVEDDLYKNSLAILVDCGNQERISDQRFKFSSFVIKIDHHIDDTPYGDISYVEEEAGSCTQIITDFAREAHLIVNKKAAFALYTGLVTDTGRFRFDSVSVNTFEDAAFLLSCGLDVSEIDNKLSVRTLKSLKLNGYTLNNFKTTENGFAYIKMTPDVLKEFDVTQEEASNQVSSLAGIEGYPVWGLFMEYDTEIRIRLRSRGPEIKTLANKYNGGGHAKASGAKLEKWEDLDTFLTDVDEVVRNYKDSLEETK